MHKTRKSLDEQQKSDEFETALESFKSLWQSINGPKSWDANPWVWVVKFKKVEKPSA